MFRTLVYEDFLPDNTPHFSILYIIRFYEESLMKRFIYTFVIFEVMNKNNIFFNNDAFSSSNYHSNKFIMYLHVHTTHCLDIRQSLVHDVVICNAGKSLHKRQFHGNINHNLPKIFFFSFKNLMVNK
jgi:hypothetical protein